jgi:acetyl-CoA C-acetyltransferase
MPSIAAIGTRPPSSGCDGHRSRGSAGSAVTPMVVAGGSALAGVTPAVVDVADVPDSFPGIGPIGYEELGFADHFGVDESVETEATTVGGQLPVNPSGGLEAKDHPPGAAGVTECVEPMASLRDDAADPVEGTRIGLAHNLGGPTAVSAVTILEGPGSGG